MTTSQVHNSRIPKAFTGTDNEKLFILLCYAAVITTGVIGNSIVILTVLTSGRASLRNMLTMFIVHLAMSDLLLCSVTAPLSVYLFMNAYWPWSSLSCKAVGSLQALNTLLSSFTLAAIALCRLRIICRQV